MSLTTKQEKFISEYISTCNATLSAKLAGYSDRSASSIASENLKKPEIINAINTYKEQLYNELKFRFVVEAQRAFQSMIEILNDPMTTSRERIVICRDFLDRAGYKPTEKKEIDQHVDGKIEITFVDPDE